MGGRFPWSKKRYSILLCTVLEERKRGSGILTAYSCEYIKFHKRNKRLTLQTVTQCLYFD